MKELTSKKSPNSERKNSDYLGKLAKMCEWKTDIKEKLIYVPEKELDAANDDLICDHLRSFGFHIQSCIEAEKNNVFSPTLTQKVKQRSVFEVYDKFKVTSTECELIIVRIEKKIQLQYLNRKKHDILVSEEQLKKALSFDLWKRL